MQTEETTPAEFLEALRSLRSAVLPPGISLTEVPGPVNVAPYSAAISLTTSDTNEDSSPDCSANGRFVIFYDPQGHDSWGGRFRLVMMLQSPTDLTIATDPVIRQVAWQWFHEALDLAGAGACKTTGTVTVEISEAFGSLRRNEETAHLEIRASWSPQTVDLSAHISAWSYLASMFAGKNCTLSEVGSQPSRFHKMGV